ncbi:uncharacterized protein CTRU02_201116 [Colletotrichum truncatum]|uniref:Uncharacterized protein n=1 Tax=Colletotrichum truncatum TaxID=5467 RepID=A0ACC3ZGT5_COLTU|nr:uncharacterized protein CTRU02_12429 [Colletotrichum truncatum]KAF6784724.1 hypothetical protein CTRU02_12429 [Colletotrichum truncatum]
MEDQKPLAPITCYTEPVHCDCPNGTYTGWAGVARLIDIIIQYYAPPRWVRWVIGTVLFIWFFTAVATKWLDFFFRVAKYRKIRSLGGDWASALSAFGPETAKDAQQRQEWEKEMGRGH